MTVLLSGHMMELSQEVSSEGNPGAIGKQKVGKLENLADPVKTTRYKETLRLNLFNYVSFMIINHKKVPLIKRNGIDLLGWTSWVTFRKLGVVTYSLLLLSIQISMQSRCIVDRRFRYQCKGGLSTVGRLSPDSRPTVGRQFSCLNFAFEFH